MGSIFTLWYLSLPRKINSNKIFNVIVSRTEADFKQISDLQGVASEKVDWPLVNCGYSESS